MIFHTSWAEKTLKKRLEGYKKWLADDSSKKNGNTSKAEEEIALFLEKNNIIHIRQKHIKSINKNYRYDFYIPSENLIIEYNGSYFHADPRIYEAEYYNKKSNKLLKIFGHMIIKKEKEQKKKGINLK